MGKHLNPKNSNFSKIISNKLYVDKTGLINYTNSLIGRENNCIALSHARRFGKSQVAQMLKAYYSSGCDSRKLFSEFKIASSPDFITHLNQYNVIYIDMSMIDQINNKNIVEDITKYLYNDFKKEFDSIDYNQNISYVLMDIYEKSNRQIVIIIDEWDCVIRHHSNDDEVVYKYLEFLHNLFKNDFSLTFLAFAYITGIMPIKKIDDESALNNFDEFTMIDSNILTSYFGFTQCEVIYLCTKYNINFDYINKWYDGYLINNIHIYNPNSICNAIIKNQIKSYWKNTSSFESINKYIKYNYNGLKEDFLLMIGGEKVDVNVDNFTNDLSKIDSRNDVLTALIHLGYLGYDATEGRQNQDIYEEKIGKAFIPNIETKKAIVAALEKSQWTEFKALSMSSQLLEATIKKDANEVARILTIAHDAYTSIIKYNSELALSCTISMAYFTALADYKIVREMPAGAGYADMAFIPLKTNPNRPAMIVELKYNESADTAIQQIEERRYAGALRGYSEEILLVGINYSLQDKKHECIIKSVKL